MTTPRILIFGGSLRRDSLNQKVAAIAAEGAREAGAEVTVIELRDFPMPIFDQDLEAASGMPVEAKKLKELFLAHDGLIIASPEYNSSVTAALKNAIDWVSRTETEDEVPIRALAGKSAVILSASPGGLGGLRGLVHLRSILGNLGIIVLPDQIAIPSAYESINPDGSLSDPKQAERVKKLGATLANHLKKILAYVGSGEFSQRRPEKLQAKLSERESLLFLSAFSAPLREIIQLLPLFGKFLSFSPRMNQTTFSPRRLL